MSCEASFRRRRLPRSNGRLIGIFSASILEIPLSFPSQLR